MSPLHRQLTAEEYVHGVLTGDRVMLGRTITLVESNAPAHLELEQDVLKQLLPHTGKSLRIGITGAPGVGKSTFIEALGCYLCEQNHRVAVLAIDPSSNVTHGSILGDKTRMERLSRQPDAFIRPSPSGGTLGGVARKTRETMLVCEAAGYDIILIETVGVGQNESTVRAMVDVVLLLLLTRAGDELQAIKKGLSECADALIIHKSDGDNITHAETARQEYERVLHLLPAATPGWPRPVLTCSSLTGAGIADIWAMLERFQQITHESGAFLTRRQTQLREWLLALINDELRTRFYHHPAVAALLPQLEVAVSEGRMPVMTAVQSVFNAFERKIIE